MEPVQPHGALFEDAIRVTPIEESSDTYSVTLRPEFCLGPVPLGGYTAAVLYRATAVHFKHAHGSRFKSAPEPTTLQITFLNRASVGPALLRVQDVKLGGRISTVHVSLLQLADKYRAATGTAKPDVTLPFLLENQDKLEVKQAAYINASPPEAESGPSATGPWMLHPLPPPGSKDDGSIDFPALARNSRDGEWEVLSFPAWAKALQQLEIYNAGPQHLATVEERRVRLADQWLRFSPGGKVGRFTNEAVVYLMDIFPIATDRMGALELSRLEKEGRVRDRSVEGLRGEEVFRWSTLTMTIDLKTRLPPAGVEWLYTRVTNMSLRGGRADVQFVTLDQDGEVIVLSSQTMLAVDVARRFGRQQPSIEKL